MYTAKAQFRHGNPVMVPHTATAAISAGDVVIVGDQVRIAHSDIANGDTKNLAIGGGVYKMPKATTTSTAIAAGKKVYWDATNQVITTSSASGANKALGYTTDTSVDADATQHVFHDSNP